MGALACLTWVGVAALFRFSSLAALVSLAAAPLYAWLLVPPPATTEVTVLAAALAILAVGRHRANLGRLLRRQEPSIGSGLETMTDTANERKIPDA